MTPIRSLLIANRGEIAVRILRTCRDLGIRTIAVYSDADRTAPHVLLADEAARIGPPPSRESYLSIPSLLAAAKEHDADAIHPGYGFLAENAEFARAVEDAGLIFVGPSASSIRAMGDKTAAKNLVKNAGVPVVPGSEDPVRNPAEAAACAEQFGYPVLLKAAAGGGGKGMRVVERKSDLASALTAARSEAASAFGDDRVYVEKYLEGPRHIEFQILGDRNGTIVHLGERECSIQRRHQKIVEESPSVLLDDALRTTMGEMAVRAAAACGYYNAGTIEFLVDKSRRFYFIEMNTRLQVEHPVTELRTGIDLVALQLRVASGEPLPFGQHDLRWQGHAMECRICAEDPENNFLPSTGTITHLTSPGGPGIREDRGVLQGGSVSVYYDSLIAKLVSWGPTRDEARARMIRALREYAIIGVRTNIPACLYVMEHPVFVGGEFDTHFFKYHPVPAQFMPDETTLRAAAAACAWLGQSSPSASHDHTAHNGRVGGWKRQRNDTMRSG